MYASSKRGGNDAFASSEQQPVIKAKNTACQKSATRKDHDEPIVEEVKRTICRLNPNYLRKEPSHKKPVTTYNHEVVGPQKRTKDHALSTDHNKTTKTQHSLSYKSNVATKTHDMIVIKGPVQSLTLEKNVLKTDRIFKILVRNLPSTGTQLPEELWRAAVTAMKKNMGHCSTSHDKFSKDVFPFNIMIIVERSRHRDSRKKIRHIQIDDVGNIVSRVITSDHDFITAFQETFKRVIKEIPNKTKSVLLFTCILTENFTPAGLVGLK